MLSRLCFIVRRIPVSFLDAWPLLRLRASIPRPAMRVNKATVGLKLEGRSEERVAFSATGVLARFSAFSV